MLTAAVLVGSVCAVHGGPIVRIVDAASGRPVVLVGTMHYNPHSIALASRAVRDAAAQSGLHATVVELCPARWDSSLATRWSERVGRGPSLKRLLSEDEFQVAFENTCDCGLDDVVLADRPIGETGRRLRSLLLQTGGDLLTPAGWRRISTDLFAAADQVPGFLAAIADARMLLGAPLAIIRYLYQSPAALPFVALSSLALVLAAAVDEATGARPAPEDAAVSVALAAFLGRAVFVSIIEERNVVLARNIRDACLADGMADGLADGMADGLGDGLADAATGRPACERTSESASVESSGRASVVVVLGMAHLEGVKRALLTTSSHK